MFPFFVQNVKNSLVQERERLFSLLKEVPYLNPYPSYSNFILCNVTSGKDPKKLKVIDCANKYKSNCVTNPDEIVVFIYVLYGTGFFILLVYFGI